MLQQLKRMAKEDFSEVCIFGVGRQGRLLYHELTGRGVSVHCFGDNAADSQNGGYCGVPCLMPEKLAAQKEGLLIIISPDDSSLIQHQLSGLDFSNLLTKRQLETPLLETIPQTGGVMA